VPEVVAVESEDGGDHGRQQHHEDGEREARPAAQIMRKQVDVDVAAQPLDVGHADQRRAQHHVGDELGLPDRRAAEHVAHEDHFADDEDRDRDHCRCQHAGDDGQAVGEADEAFDHRTPRQGR
jgi:hypothetical protein